MKVLKYSILLLCILTMNASAWSQERPLKLNINFAIGIPTGNLKTITDQVSTRGWDASLLYSINNNISLGLQTGMQDFYQRYPRQVFHENGSDLSAVITYSIQVTPIMLKAKYRFSNTPVVEPYLALAAGANLVSYRKYYGSFSDSRSAAKFAAQPEAGIVVPFGEAKRVGLNVSAAYNIMPYKYQEVDGLHHLSVKGGLVFALR